MSEDSLKKKSQSPKLMHCQIDFFSPRNKVCLSAKNQAGEEKTVSLEKTVFRNKKNTKTSLRALIRETPLFVDSQEINHNNILINDFPE